LISASPFPMRRAGMISMATLHIPHLSGHETRIKKHTNRTRISL
jgi:hypothetical protein